MTDLVTGEAVQLEMRLAKLASRGLALALDILVQMGLLVVGVVVLSGTALFVDDALATAIGLVFYVLVILGYPVAFETFTRGRSLGKMAMGLRVVREDGGPVRFRHAFVRGLLGVVEIWLTFGTVALIASLASAKGRRIGDYLAGTVVVHERVPVRAAPVAAMPPQLIGWAQQLDLSRVPDDLALAARQFLARAPELSPQVRDEMGTSLARALGQVTAPPPPPGVPAWAFLSAVLAERRRREMVRLGGPPPTYVGWPGPSAPPPPPPPPPPTFAPTPPVPTPPAPASPAGDQPFAPPS
ncbi:MAG: hypothetical protein QOD68_510 [Actinomycetota bacterium]|nr:hypothetical protein [Actinomycetota bacterium]